MEEDSKGVELAKQLRKCCNKEGKEIDLEKSVQVLHQFALLYRQKSPDKISLIRSAVFFNAALVRQPGNNIILQDLKELCLHVLELAGAKTAESDLLQISDQVKKRIDVFRHTTKEALNDLKIIPLGLPESQLIKLKDEKVAQVQDLQNTITAIYTDIMNFTTEKTNMLLGIPPCKFSVVGMGSLARKEITPYSDFEHVLVLEDGVQFKQNYNMILEYFRWFTVVFQFIIINLQETIVPCVAVPVLNNCNIPNGDWFYDRYTPRGISFDGMMMHASKFPLGRTQTSTKRPWTTELIRPVSEMVKYLEVEEDFKNGYHLADILTKICYVSGNKKIYEDFETAVASILKSTSKNSEKQVMSLLWNDLRNYNIVVTSKSMRLSPVWNVKSVVYRTTTLFVAALGRLFLIRKYSCFEIISELLKAKKINEEVAKQLSFAIAVACETRLKVYSSKNGQYDLLGMRNVNIYDQRVTTQLVNILGEQCLGDYFCIAYSLQHSLRNFDLDKEIKLKIPLQNQFQLLQFLDLRKMILSEWGKLNVELCDPDTKYYLHYTVAYVQLKNKNYDDAVQVFDYLESCSELSESLLVKVKRRKAYCLLELRRYSECLRYISESNEKIRLLKHFTSSEAPHANGYLLAIKADCKRWQGDFEEARLAYVTAIKHIKNSSSPFKNNLLIKCMYFLGVCESKLSFLEKALQNGLQAVELCKITNIEILAECRCYRLIGECFLHLQLPDKALFYFQHELKLRSDFDQMKDGAISESSTAICELIDQAKQNIYNSQME